MPPQAINVPNPPTPPAGAADTVMVRFWVDATGRVDPRSLRVEGTGDAAYRRGAEQALARGRFIPARLDGCPVPAPWWIRHLPDEPAGETP